jgi:hypothetical protein
MQDSSVQCHRSKFVPLGPKLHLGPHLRGTLFRNLSPVRDNLHHPRLPHVISSTAVSPVAGVIHIAPLDGVQMDVFQLLPHHFPVRDLLRMAAFLPELIRALRLVIPLVHRELTQERFRVTFGEKFENRPGREPFESLHRPTQVRSRGDQVQVVFEDHEPIKRELGIRGEKSPTVEDDVDRFGPSEDGQPAVDRAGQKVRIMLFEDTVSAAGHEGMVNDGVAFEKGKISSGGQPAE